MRFSFINTQEENRTRMAKSELFSN
uniref:Uncharacterized protein n=1 Tax=Anguilla anguilla TaxID=7936 RepID=A0A0E9VQI7_ANGAN